MSHIGSHSRSSAIDGMMNKLKKQAIFQDVDMRRLRGILVDHAGYVQKALELIDTLEPGISLDDALFSEGPEELSLRYYLERLGIN